LEDGIGIMQIDDGGGTAKDGNAPKDDHGRKIVPWLQHGRAGRPGGV
jgi:hypothetical protein